MPMTTLFHAVIPIRNVDFHRLRFVDGRPRISHAQFHPVAGVGDHKGNLTWQLLMPDLVVAVIPGPYASLRMGFIKQVFLYEI